MVIHEHSGILRVVRDVLQKANERTQFKGQPPRQKMLQRGRRHSHQLEHESIESDLLDQIGKDLAADVDSPDDDASGDSASPALAPEVRAHIAELFASIDRDASGFVDKDEFLKAIRKKNVLTGLPKKELMQALDDADKDRNGQLSLDEFEVVISRLLRKKQAEASGDEPTRGGQDSTTHRKLAPNGST